MSQGISPELGGSTPSMAHETITGFSGEPRCLATCRQQTRYLR